MTEHVEHPNLAAALAAFQAEAPKIVKDATAKVTGENKQTGEKVKYTYGYADLANVTEALNPILGKHGLAFTSKPTLTSQGFGLVYALKHEGGETDEGFWPLPDPTRTKPQDMGSWITYWRRYAFLAVTNTFPSGEDDDGAKASSRERWEDASPVRQAFDQHQRGIASTSEEQGEPRPPKTSWTDEEVAGYVRKIRTSSATSVLNAYDWMASKNLHNREVTIDGETGTATQAMAVTIGMEAIKTTSTVEHIETLKAAAADRGMLKIQVSPTETLEEVLYEAHELAAHAADQVPEATNPNDDGS